MNIKNITLSIALSIVSISVYCMETTPEMALIAGQISPRNFLYKIERGLYGPNLASQMKTIKSVEYEQHRNVRNLYTLLLQTLQFAVNSKQYDNSEGIKKLTITQIESKYRMLQDYVTRRLVQMPSSSGSGE